MRPTRLSRNPIYFAGRMPLLSVAQYEKLYDDIGLAQKVNLLLLLGSMGNDIFYMQGIRVEFPKKQVSRPQ
jgi:hypothetical protein